MIAYIFSTPSPYFWMLLNIYSTEKTQLFSVVFISFFG